MESNLRAGIAIYNAGEYHAAHDAWEEHWLGLSEGNDEQFLHGLIQFTAAVYHAHNANWSGATGLADSAQGYLAGLPERYRQVNIDQVRTYLTRLDHDPATVERTSPATLRFDGEPICPEDLDLEDTVVAATVLAAEYGYDEQLIEQAGTYATRDVDAGQTRSPFVSFLFDFVREPENRAVVIQRLSEHVARRSRREDDVSGLFDQGE